MKRISLNSVLTILVLISVCFARADVNDDIATIKKLENATAVALLKNDVKFLEKKLESFIEFFKTNTNVKETQTKNLMKDWHTTIKLLESAQLSFSLSFFLH